MHMRFGCEMPKLQRKHEMARITYGEGMDDKLLELRLLWPSYQTKPGDEVDEIVSKTDENVREVVRLMDGESQPY